MKKRLGIAHIRKIKRHLKAGGVIAYPTESCYGLGCLPNHSRGLKRVIRLKKRPQYKGMIVIGDNWMQLKPWLKAPSAHSEALILQTWPAAVTFLLPAAKKVLPLLRGNQHDRLAVRVPDHALARQLCRQIQSALVSTSCNRAGKKPCKTERDTRRRFGRDVLVVGGLIGGYRTPSQIIDAISGKRLR